MADYVADDYTYPMPDASNSSGVVVRAFKFTVPSVGFAQNDTVKLCRIPGTMGIILVDFDIEVPDLDSDERPAIQLEVGDNDTAAKFVAASTFGQAASRIAYQNNGVAGSIPVSYTAANDLVLTVQTGPATAATSGTITGWLQYVQFGLGPAV